MRERMASPDKPFRRAFNYNGSSVTLHFEISRSGRYVFQTAGERKSLRVSHQAQMMRVVS